MRPPECWYGTDTQPQWLAGIHEDLPGPQCPSLQVNMAPSQWRSISGADHLRGILAAPALLGIPCLVNKPLFQLTGIQCQDASCESCFHA